MSILRIHLHRRWTLSMWLSIGFYWNYFRWIDVALDNCGVARRQRGMTANAARQNCKYGNMRKSKWENVNSIHWSGQYRKTASPALLVKKQRGVDTVYFLCTYAPLLLINRIGKKRRIVRPSPSLSPELSILSISSNSSGQSDVVGRAVGR